MNSERAAALNDDLAHRVVDPQPRLPAERSNLPLGSGGPKVMKDRERPGKSAPGPFIDPRDFCSHPIPTSDPDELWKPLPAYPARDPGPDAADNLERVLNYRKQRGA